MISGRLLCVAIAIAIAVAVGVAVAEKAEGERVAQVHLSLTGDLTSMGLDYVSSLDSYSAIEYTAQDPSSSTWTAPGVAPGTAPGHSATASLARSTYIYYENIGFLHTAVLDNLLPKTVYAYRIGDANSDSWSDQWFHFTTGPYERSEFYRKGESIESVSGEGVAAVYADLGVYNGLSVNRLLHEANQSIFDYTLHIGDISYDLFSDNSSVGNTYMNMMEPITSKFPLMVGEGNHEKSDNFTEYNYRFKSIENLAGKNSKSNSNHFYSFDVGLVHYVMVSTEVYNYPTQARDGPSPFTADEQLTWLEEDLVKANDPAQRKKVPWIVLMGHRPWYTTEFEVTSGTSFHDFDDLGCQYGVDLYITGHVHNYQRYHPLRTGSSFIPKEVDTDCVSSDGHVYTDPKFMPTIVAGSTGCHSPLPRVACPVMAVASDLFLKDALAHCSAAYGFGHLQAVNSTHLYWEFVQSHKAASIDDPKYCEWMSANSPMVSDSYKHLLSENDISLEEFGSKIESQCKSWTLNEGINDIAVADAASDPFAVAEISSSGSRLVRDYLWLVRSATPQGPRDYC